MAGAGSRGGTSKSTFYRAWREGQLSRFGRGSITAATHPPNPVRRHYDYERPEASRLKTAREAAGVSIGDLAAIIGVSKTVLSQIEDRTRTPNS